MSYTALTLSDTLSDFGGRKMEAGTGRGEDDDDIVRTANCSLWKSFPMWFSRRRWHALAWAKNSIDIRFPDLGMKIRRQKECRKNQMCCDKRITSKQLILSAFIFSISKQGKRISVLRFCWGRASLNTRHYFTLAILCLK